MPAPYLVTIIAYDSDAQLAPILNVPGVKTVLHQVCETYEEFVLYQKTLAAGVFIGADAMVEQKRAGKK